MSAGGHMSNGGHMSTGGLVSGFLDIAEFLIQCIIPTYREILDFEGLMCAVV